MRNVVSWKPLVLGASFLLYGAGTAFATETDHLYPTPSTGFMSVQQDGRQINCHIVDKSGPIVGANVVVKGTTIGNISDMSHYRECARKRHLSSLLYRIRNSRGYFEE